MSGFYARYVPPGSSNKTSSTSVEANGVVQPEKKRKRSTATNPKDKKSSKRRKSSPDGESRTNEAIGDTQSSVHADEGEDVNVNPVLSKYSVTATAERNNADVRIKKSQSQSADLNQRPDTTDSQPAKKDKKPKKGRRADPEGNDAEGTEYQQKHLAVLSKFDEAKSRRKAEGADELTVADEAEPVHVHGLEPIPQPEDKTETTLEPQYSTLPSWQSDAVTVVHGSHKLFSDFALTESTVSNLQKSGLQESFAIQTTVLPLLLEGFSQHDGDLCISAATGSGKTLAYVLPMVEALKRFSTTKLRGVIVVPTRELVQQVRQLCEICAAGSGIKIATSTGNKSLKDEQAMLVERDQLYNPREYQRRRDAPIDWANFSIVKLMRDAQSRKPFEGIGFVEQWNSKVDILITTPGRLVDHLKSTQGFNLDYVQWLVVDEADRLLNESYQEWIETVMPALRSQAATKQRDEQLRYMRMDVPKRVVKKVLMSATMTRDISKLNSLELNNPKLVILGSHDSTQSSRLEKVEQKDEPRAGDDGTFHLPPSLTEYTVTVKDGAEKPLHLLHLLNTKIIVLPPLTVNSGKDEHEITDTNSDSSNSSSLTSSDGDSTTSDSGSESEPSPSSDTSKSLLDNKPTSVSQSTPQGRQSRALIFTRSTASASRLSRLLSLLSPSLTISTLTRSTASSSTSRRSLKSFISGRTTLLIATDRASRGLDIPDLEHVVSYDVPSSALTYVHRVGRTARAGKEGTAWTMVEWREGRWFGEEIGGKTEKETKIKRQWKMKKWEVRLPEGQEGQELRARYESALKQLGEEVRGKK